MIAVRFGFAAALLAAVVAVTPATAGKRDNSLRVADEQVLDNADPYFNSARIGVILSHQVWDTLIYRDPDTGEYKGQLATAWKWIDDKTLELDLRIGVKFHNGAELDADDVVYTLNFVSKPENNVTTQSNVDWLDRAEKLGKHKVRIIARAPFPAAIEYLAGPIAIHPHAYYAKAGPKGMNEKPIGSGPYRWSSTRSASICGLPATPTISRTARSRSRRSTRSSCASSRTGRRKSLKCSRAGST
jgi:peptide/nickel transport system substrate-binding protein